jgi:hypothetical protein
MKLELLTTDYNRNGSSGCGFTKVLFILTEDGNSETLLAVLPHNAEDGFDIEQCFITNPRSFAKAYRGDRIAAELIPLLAN